MTKKATFGAGCFWGVEASFKQLSGVTEVVSGYSGGTIESPTYEQVCTGRTGHAEVVQVNYDPDRISYNKLLEAFWAIHDPTTLNRQGPDVGTQYRSVIFVHDDEQKAAALESKEEIERSGRFADPIVTEIAPFEAFYPAEEYHQRYYEKHGIACRLPPNLT
jgi:peptide-methionine (S)-S-oxide reductase